MRVLLISHTCQSRREGQPKAAQINHDNGIDLHVLVPDRWREYGRWRLAEQPVNSPYCLEVGHIRMAWSGPGQWYLHHYPALAKILREFRPDVIDIWEEPWGLVSAQTVWLRNRILPNTKIISETEQNTAKKLPPPFESFRRYTLRNSQYVIGRSDEAIANVRQLGYRGPTAVVPNAVDAKLFHPLNRQECREKLDLSGFVVGYIGRFVEEKGLSDLIRSLKYCPDDVNLLLVGRGPYRETLENLIASLRLKSRVRLMPQCPLDELPPMMNAIDTLALPSRTTPRWKEQFGRVLIEAQACKTPVIGSSSGDIPCVVGDAGLIFPEGNVKKLAAAIVELRDDPALRKRMGERGRKQVEELYTWGQVGSRMRHIYETVHSGTDDTGIYVFAKPPVIENLVPSK